MSSGPIILIDANIVSLAAEDVALARVHARPSSSRGSERSETLIVVTVSVALTSQANTTINMPQTPAEGSHPPFVRDGFVRYGMSPLSRINRHSLTATDAQIDELVAEYGVTSAPRAFHIHQVGQNSCPSL